jgi:hypothetical protein
MPDMFREQPRVRLASAVLICVVVWSLFVVRLLFGVGPMHDHQGNQAPLSDYIVGAVTGTVLAVAWIVARNRMTRNK